MGRRTSVYLDDALEAAFEAADIPLADLLRISLGLMPDADGMVLIAVPVSEEMLERIDAVRGLRSRSQWFEGAIEAALEPGQVPGPVEVIPVEPKTVLRRSGRSAASSCAHRGLRPGAWCKGCESVVPERKAAARA